MPRPENTGLGTLPDFLLPLTTDNSAGENGRVTINKEKLGDPYAGLPGFAPQITVEPDFQADMLRGNWETTPVSTGFFSASNVERIQQLIRKGVFDGSKGKQYLIDNQSTDELKIIMRAIYYQYARNMTSDIAGQVEDLNKKVVDWSVPHILSAVDMYFYYINDITKLPVPLAQPQHLSRAGTKSLPFKPFM